MIPIFNHQPIEKKDPEQSGKTLDVHSIFYTIQGEGPYAGKPAVFIRLAGCNLQCPGCDTDYTLSRELLTVEQIMAEVTKHPRPANSNYTPLVVITGGEPFRQNLLPLIEELSLHEYILQIETNGTLEIPASIYKLALIVCSPKAGKVASPSRINYWKYVMHHEGVDPEDGLPVLALGHSASPRVARPNIGGPSRYPTDMIYLQPMDCLDEDTNKKNLDACVQSCLKYGYTLGVQMHKIINMP